MLLACGQAFSVRFFATQIHYDNLIDYHMNDNKSFCHSAHALIHARTLVGTQMLVDAVVVLEVGAARW